MTDKTNSNKESPELSNLTQTPMSEIVQINAVKLIEDSIAGSEAAFKKLFEYAIKATRDSDWLDMGGKPYLAETGIQRAAIRFGASIQFERDSKGEALIIREEFEDKDHGKNYIYTVHGTASIGNRRFEAMGSASTLDSFLAGKGEKFKPIQERLQLAKKKAVTNFYNRALQALLGTKGFSWEDLKGFGINKSGKGAVDFKSKKKDEPLGDAPKIDKNRPYWTWDNEGTRWLYVKKGNHFTEEWLLDQGFKATAKDPTKFGVKFTNAVFKNVEEQWNNAEAMDQSSPESGE